MSLWMRIVVAWLLSAVLPLHGVAAAALVHCGHYAGMPSAASHGVVPDHPHASHGARGGHSDLVAARHHPVDHRSVVAPDSSPPSGSDLAAAGQDTDHAHEGWAEDPSGARCIACMACCMSNALPATLRAPQVEAAHLPPGTAATELAVEARLDVLLRPPRATSPG